MTLDRAACLCDCEPTKGHFCSFLVSNIFLNPHFLFSTHRSSFFATFGKLFYSSFFNKNTVHLFMAHVKIVGAFFLKLTYYYLAGFKLRIVSAYPPRCPHLSFCVSPPCFCYRSEILFFKRLTSLAFFHHLFGCLSSFVGVLLVHWSFLLCDSIVPYFFAFFNW